MKMVAAALGAGDGAGTGKKEDGRGDEGWREFIAVISGGRCRMCLEFLVDVDRNIQQVCTDRREVKERMMRLARGRAE